MRRPPTKPPASRPTVLEQLRPGQPTLEHRHPALTQPQDGGSGTPLPFRDTVCGFPSALSANEMVPVKGPSLIGVERHADRTFGLGFEAGAACTGLLKARCDCNVVDTEPSRSRIAQCERLLCAWDSDKPTAEVEFADRQLRHRRTATGVRQQKCSKRNGQALPQAYLRRTEIGSDICECRH